MATRVAVMDLGTNTFHLLIAEKTDDGITKLCHLENSCKLGEGGMPDGNISKIAFDRGIAAMIDFKQAIDKYSVQKIKAIGTSAIRSAKNGTQFIEKVKEKTGVLIESITGDEEAQYIYEGVKSSDIISDQTTLILDIGGGSVEFIIANQDKIFWKHSYEIGAARLMQKFHLSDPIHKNEIQHMEEFLDSVLTDLSDAVEIHRVKSMIGSSGAFETFAELAELRYDRTYNLNLTATYRFKTETLIEILDYLIASTHAEREANNNIIPVRVDMIVTASVVTRYLIMKFKINEVAMSVYSLKEGVLAELLN